MDQHYVFKLRIYDFVSDETSLIYVAAINAAEAVEIGNEIKPNCWIEQLKDIDMRIHVKGESCQQ